MKKRKQTELDVDFIGGQGPLTKSEKQAISQFIKTQKLLRARKKIDSNRGRRTQTRQRKKIIA